MEEDDDNDVVSVLRLNLFIFPQYFFIVPIYLFLFSFFFLLKALFLNKSDARASFI